MQENAKTPRIGFSLLAGALAGFINGFFGAGGGMVLVPLLSGFAGSRIRQRFHPRSQ